MEYVDVAVGRAEEEPAEPFEAGVGEDPGGPEDVIDDLRVCRLELASRLEEIVDRERGDRAVRGSREQPLVAIRRPVDLEVVVFARVERGLDDLPHECGGEGLPEAEADRSFPL